MIRVPGYILMALFVVPVIVWGAPPAGTAPISVKADRLQTDGQGRSAVFSGQVVATQGDLVIYSDTLTVVYADQKKEVKEVRAEGNVRIVQGERLGFAGRAIYDNAAGVIRLEENPSVRQGDDVITGTTILYQVAERKSTVEGGKGKRVEAIIHPAGGGLTLPGVGK